jgi:hypothetical protein
MYKLKKEFVLRLSDNAAIPFDDGNSDYEAYKQWKEAGGVEVEDAPVLSTPEEIKHAIDIERDKLLEAGVVWDGDRWHTNNDFILHLNSFISAFNNGMLPAGLKLDIRTKTNTVRKLGLDELKTLAITVMMYVQKVFAESWQQKDAVK